MKKKYSIEFKLSHSPISKPITKFGGQPVWINQAQWPISKKTGKPMMFIGQIKLEPWLFGRIEGRMAYIFMAEDKKGDSRIIDIAYSQIVNSRRTLQNSSSSVISASVHVCAIWR